MTSVNQQIAVWAKACAWKYPPGSWTSSLLQRTPFFWNIGAGGWDLWLCSFKLKRVIGIFDSFLGETELLLSLCKGCTGDCKSSKPTFYFSVLQFRTSPSSLSHGRKSSITEDSWFDSSADGHFVRWALKCPILEFLVFCVCPVVSFP